MNLILSATVPASTGVITSKPSDRKAFSNAVIMLLSSR